MSRDYYGFIKHEENKRGRPHLAVHPSQTVLVFCQEELIRHPSLLRQTAEGFDCSFQNRLKICSHLKAHKAIYSYRKVLIQVMWEEQNESQR